MKLQELIDKLQVIEKSKPGMDVAFQFADIHGGSTRSVYLLAVEAEATESIFCLITVGDYENEATAYKERKARQQSV